MVQLTEAVIRAKTRVHDLGDVKNLNLWGQGITDVSFLAHTPNVEILSLSINSISSLQHFLHCKELKELYLRKNDIHCLQDIRFLMPLAHLRVLWLSDNPCSELPNYRQFVIANLPQLTKLDNQAIDAAELVAAQQHMPLLQPATSADLLCASEEVHQLTTEVSNAAKLTAPVASSPLTKSCQEKAALPQAPACNLTSDTGNGHAAVLPEAYHVPSATEGKHLAAAAGPAGANIAAIGQLTFLQQQHPTHTPLLRTQSKSEQTQQPDLLFAHMTQQPDMTIHPGWTPTRKHVQQVQLQPQPPVATGGAALMSSRNVLYAVMALLKDLDLQALQIVHREVELQLQGLQAG